MGLGERASCGVGRIDEEEDRSQCGDDGFGDHDDVKLWCDMLEVELVVEGEDSRCFYVTV